MSRDESGDDAGAALALVEEILDPRRLTSVLAVSVAAEQAEPLVDVDALRAELGSAATVRVVRTGPATWTLKRHLPAGLDVFGDAVRVWRPGALQAAEHPLVLLHPGVEPAGLVRRLRDLVGDHRTRAAVVSSVSDAGAVLLLADGSTVAVERHQITRHLLPAHLVLRAAQHVQVLLVGPDPGWATLRPVEPDPRDRLLTHYGPGAVLLGRVLARTAAGDHPVELLPGVVGLVPADPTTPAWAEGEVVAVAILDRDLRLAPRPAEPGVRAASLYPDGPPWLAQDPLMAELPALPSTREWSAQARHEQRDAAGQVDDLADLVRRAARAHDDARTLVAGVDDEVARLRAEAAALRHELETDLVDLRQRVLRSLAEEHDAAEQLMLEAFETARAEIVRLRSLLADSDDARRTMRRELSDVRAVEAGHRVELAKAREAVRRERDKAHELQRELDAVVPPAERFSKAVRRAWLRQTTKADRVRYPWREPVVGPSFLVSLDRLEGVGIDRVLEVCAEVVCGRAAERAGMQVHALRSSSGGGSGQRTRPDGARAFRVSLQVRSAAARRLHYWKLPDGRVELAQIGYHDDFTIR